VHLRATRAGKIRRNDSGAARARAASRTPGASNEATADTSKPATEATKRHNAKVRASLDFNDKQDFEDAARGLVGRPDKLTINGAKSYSIVIENGVLTASTKLPASPDATVTLTKPALDALFTQRIDAGKVDQLGRLESERQAGTRHAVLGLLDTFPFWFNIVTP